MSAQKFTKKDLKHDSFIDSAEHTLEFAQKHAMTLGIVVLAVVVVLVGFSYMKNARESSRARASYLLYQGQTLLASGQAELAVGPLQECVNRYGSTVFGKYARVGLVKALLAQGQFDAALANSDADLKAVGGEGPAVRGLKLARAAALSSLGRNDEAAEAYGQLAQSATTDAERYDLLVRQSDCLREAGKLQEALKVLEDIDAKVASGELKGVQTSDLDVRLAMLKALAG